MADNTPLGAPHEVRPEETPFTREYFLVESRMSRCLAYKDEDGKWHGAFTDMELPEPVRILG